MHLFPEHKFSGLTADYYIHKMEKEVEEGLSLDEIEKKRNAILDFFEQRHVGIKHISVISGPSVSLYKLELEKGVRIKNVKNQLGTFAEESGFNGVRAVMLEDTIGIEIANDKQTKVPLKAILESKAFKNSTVRIPLAIGYSTTQELRVIDLAEASHLLIVGASEQGQRQFIQAIALSIMQSFSKNIQLAYINTRDEAVHLSEGKKEWERLTDVMYERLANPSEDYPRIVVIAYDLADLIYPVGRKEDKQAAKDIYTSIVRLLQKGHLAGIHLVLATQRPSKDVVTGLIKANIPTRLAFRVCTRADSLTVLDMPGAEALIGDGDMILSIGERTERVQAPSISPDEADSFEKLLG